MDASNATTAFWLISGILVLTACIVYGLVSRRVFRSGGKIHPDSLGRPDLIAGSLLSLWFFSIVGRGFHDAPRAVSNNDIIATAVLIFLIVTCIVSFLVFRNISVVKLIGLRRISVRRAAAIAVVLLLAAYPLIGATTLLMENQLGTDAHKQEIVSFFSNAAQTSHFASVFVTIALGVFLAPIAEEFIFRGYLYGICKKYLGVFAGILINAFIFALFHVNLTSLPALCILAICLTLAYEFSGSILVPMMMHALFNSVTFGALLADAYLRK